MTDKSTPTKVVFAKGDIVEAPFAHDNGGGVVFSKHRPAYVAGLDNGDAQLVYISSSPSTLERTRYGGKIELFENGLTSPSYWDAGRTTTVSTEHLKRESIKLPEQVREEIELSIAREKKDLMDAREKVRSFREQASQAVTPSYAAEKSALASHTATKTHVVHQHVRISQNGDVKRLSFDRKWEHAGKVLPETLEIMQRRVSHPAPASATSPTANAERHPADEKITVINDKGKEALLGPKSKEHLREAIHSELGKAGHAAEAMPAAADVKKISIALAGARHGEMLVVTAQGAGHLVPKGGAYPVGATALDAIALRTSAKIAESAFVRGIAGPQAEGFKGVMAATVFFDNASGHALSAGPLGQAIGYLGDKSGAFAVTMKAQELLEPLMDKASKTVAELAEKSGVTAVLSDQLAKQASNVESLLKSTGLDTVLKSAEQFVTTGKGQLETLISDNVHGPDNPAHKTAEGVPVKSPERVGAHAPAEQVHLNLSKGMQEAGNGTFKLTAAESAHLAKELRHVRPGDLLVVEKSGEMYLSVVTPGQKQPSTSPNAVLFDADALRENSGIARTPALDKPAPPQQHAAAESPQADMARSM